MIHAEIEGSQIGFKSEADLIAYQTPPDNPAPITKAGIRMARKRRREANARLFWRLRLKTGTANMALINDALEHAPDIVETARLKVNAELHDFAAAYPERAEAVT